MVVKSFVCLVQLADLVVETTLGWVCSTNSWAVYARSFVHRCAGVGHG